MTLLKQESIKLDLPLERIAAICRKYRVLELDIFGSILRDDFGPDSDVDFLVRFQNDDAGPWMGKLAGLEQEISQLIGRKVDVVSRPAVEESENYLRRRHILLSARTIYDRRYEQLDQGIEYVYRSDESDEVRGGRR